MVVTGATRHTEKGTATRERIVRAAVELIDANGADRMSLDDVAERSSASKGQLYHYFSGRDELVRAAVSAKADDVLDLQHGLMDELDDRASIERWFDCLVELQVDGDSRGGCPLASLTGALAERDEAARAILVDAFDRWERVLADGLASMQVRGDLGAHANTRTLATSVMALVQGGLVLTQARRDPLQLRQALDAALVLLDAAASPT